MRFKECNSTHNLYILADRCVCRLEGDPEILTYDRQVLLLTGNHKYTMTKDMSDASDPCSFNVEVKAGYMLRQQRVRWATTIPRFIDIEILGYNIRLDQNHQVHVSCFTSRTYWWVY